MAQLCQRDEKSWQIAWVYIYQATGGARRDGSPSLPIKPGCEQTKSSGQIELIYPEHNAVLYLPKGFSGKREKFIFKAAHAREEATIYWHLDDTYQTQTQDFHKISLQPAPGKHSLTAVDGEGNTVSTTFFIE